MSDAPAPGVNRGFQRKFRRTDRKVLTRNSGAQICTVSSSAARGTAQTLCASFRRAALMTTRAHRLVSPASYLASLLIAISISVPHVGESTTRGANTIEP